MKKYWYCFSYIGNSGGSNANACTYVGYDKKRITKQMIEENKTYAGLGSNSVLISATFLGYMTRAEFEGE